MNATPSPPAPLPRKAQVFAFLVSEISRGRQPTNREIADAMGFSKGRAQAIVEQLTRERRIERTPGAHRAIRIPGLAELVLRAGGAVVNEDFLRPDALTRAYPCPKTHLPLVAILTHLPDPAPAPAGPAGGDADGIINDRKPRARGAARRAPRAGRAAPETEAA